MGREDGLRPADMVGAIAGEAGIPGSAIGATRRFWFRSRIAVTSLLVPGSVSGRGIAAAGLLFRRDRSA